MNNIIKIIFLYILKAGDLHVCGNNGFNKSGWPINTQITGNVTRTYTSGSIVTMTAQVIKNGHTFIFLFLL